MKLFLKLIAFFVLIVIIGSCVPKTHYERIDLVSQIYNSCKGKWKKNIIYEKKVTIYAKGLPVRKINWKQIVSEPMYSHIRTKGFESGNGAILKNDTAYQFSSDSIESIKYEINPILLMTHGVCFLPPDTTKQKLAYLGCDYENTHIAEWNGRKVFVMGTVTEGDLSQTQFWIDCDNLFLVRAIIVSEKETKEYRFDKFEEKEGVWIANEVVILKNSMKIMKQEVIASSFPESISDSIFNVMYFKDVRW